MARTWTRPDLTGTKDGANTSFTIPSLPDGAKVWLIYNGRILFEVALTPDALQYSRTGAAVEVGLAPAANDTLWAYVIAEDAEGIATAIALVQEIRRTFYYNAEARDKNGDLQEIIEKDISSSFWTYYPIGGCGEAEIILRRPYDDYGEIGLDWDLQIWRDIDTLGQAGARLPAELPIQLGTAHQGARELRWGGFVREIQRVLADPDEHVVLRCAGWSRQLAYIFIPEQDVPWVNMDIGAIVRDIIDRFVVPGTRIKRTPVNMLVPDTGVIIDQINFDTSAFDALRVLGEIAGNAEWGVRADKEFYFFQPTTSIKHNYTIGDRIALYRPSTNTDEIVKTVYLRGANGFKATLNLGAPEEGFYKQRREFVAAIQSEDIATLWGAAYFARFGESQPSGQLTLAATDDWIENVSHPMGLLRVIGGPVFVSPGDTLPAQLPMKLGNIYGKYTDERFRIASIRYQPTDDALQIDVGLGERKRPLADLLGTINYKLGELAQGLSL